MTASRGRGSRRKGHEYEREVAQGYRNAGYVAAATARSESGGMQKGCDVLGVPYSVECKCRSNFSVREAARIVAADPAKAVVHVKLDRLDPVIIMSESLWFAITGRDAL